MPKDFQSEPTYQGRRVLSERTLPPFRQELRQWRSLFAGRHTVPTDIFVGGDSISEGYFATQRHLRWQDQLRRILNADCGEAAFSPGYIPAVRGSQGVIPATWKREWRMVGGAADIVNFGLGRRSWAFNAAGQSATLTENCEGFAIRYAKGAAVGQALVYVDESLVATIDSYQAQLGSGSFLLGPFPKGEHTVKIVPTVPGAGGGVAYSFILEGAYCYGGDWNSGVRVWDASRSGESFAQANVNANWIFSAASPANSPLVLIALGVNDWGQTIANTRLRAQGVIDKWKTAQPNANICLVVMYGRGDSGATDAGWQPYRELLHELAKTNGAAIIDLYNLMGFIGADPNGLTTDLLHPSDRGHRMIAEHVAEVLLTGENTPVENLDDAIRITRKKIRPPAVVGLPLMVYGHSMTQDVNNTPGSNWVDRMRQELGFSWVLNKGVGGNTVQDVANQSIPVNGMTSTSGGRFQNLVWTPGLKVALFVAIGGNELIAPDGAAGAVSQRQLDAITENLRAVFANFSCGTHDEIHSATWTFVGAWTGSTDDSSSNRAHVFTTTQGDYTEKLLAAGDYYVFFRTSVGPAPAINPLVSGIARIDVGGVQQHLVDLNAKAWDLQTGTFIRELGWAARKITVPAGGAVVRITKNDATAGYVTADFVAPVLANRPPIWYLREFLGTKANNDLYQAAVQPIIEEFWNVFDIDVRNGFDAVTMLGADGVHPNDLGEMHLFDGIARRIGDTARYMAGWHDVTGAALPGALLTWSPSGATRYLEMWERGYEFRMNLAVPMVVVQPGDDRPHPNGTEFRFVHTGAGSLTFQSLGGAYSINATTLVSPGPGSIARFRKASRYVWDLEWTYAPTVGGGGSTVDEAMVLMGGF